MTAPTSRAILLNEMDAEIHLALFDSGRAVRFYSRNLDDAQKAVRRLKERHGYSVQLWYETVQGPGPGWVADLEGDPDGLCLGCAATPAEAWCQSIVLVLRELVNR